MREGEGGEDKDEAVGWEQMVKGLSDETQMGVRQRRRDPGEKRVVASSEAI